jgi:hypothetical protein
MRRKYILAIVGAALALGIAACSDLPAPRGQEGGGAGAESLDVIESVPAPEAVEGVVPEVINVQAEEAVAVVEAAGFTAVAEPLGLQFTSGGRIKDTDVICTQDPAGGEEPAANTEVMLVFDDKCAAKEE